MRFTIVFSLISLAIAAPLTPDATKIVGDASSELTVIPLVGDVVLPVVDPSASEKRTMVDDTVFLVGDKLSGLGNLSGRSAEEKPPKKKPALGGMLGGLLGKIKKPYKPKPSRPSKPEPIED